MSVVMNISQNGFPVSPRQPQEGDDVESNRTDILGQDEINDNLTSIRDAIQVEGWLADQFSPTAEQGQGSSTKSIGRIICIYANFLSSIENVYSPYYDTTLSSKIRSMDEADLFLLADFHDKESPWRALNGKFISYLANYYELLIFVESAPSMGGVDSESTRKRYIIESKNPFIYFYGWDAATEIMEPVQKVREKVMEKFEECAILSKNIEDTKKTYQEGLDSVSSRVCTTKTDEIVQVLDRLTILEKMVALRTELSVKIREREELLGLLTSAIDRTFPLRTAAQVSTLNRLRPFSAKRSFLPRKVVFIAGATHLKENPQNIKKETYCLTSLYQEMENHHAISMIPSIGK